MSIFGGGGKSAAKTPTRAMGLNLQGAQYGAPIPVVFGQNKVAGNVIWYGDFQAIGHQQQQPGKGGGGGSSGTTYTYKSSYMLGLSEGPASIVNVYDGSSVKSLASVGGIGFTGTLGQAPWAHLTGVQALGYSGTALAAFQNKDLGGSASLPNYNFEMAGRNQFGSGILDANPADIVTAICTDTQIGVAFNALGDLTQYKNYCTAAGLFFSPAYATQQTATQTLDELFKYSNSAPYFSEGVLKVVPYGDAVITGNGVTFTPNVTAVVDLGRDDFITNGPGDPVTVKRIGPADAMNIVRVEYKDRANTYHTSAVIASIDQDVVGTGARADQSDSVDMITTAPVARLVSQNLLQRIFYIRNTYEFQLSWRYCHLEPMDVVTLTDANTGLYLTPVRITEISEDEHGLLSVVAEEFPDGVSHGGIYATQANAGATVDTNADPGAIDGPYLFRGPGFLVSNNQPEIWCALSGNDPMWAGCDVYLSHDGTSYTYLATHSRRASYGTLTNTLPSAADPDTTSAPNVVLNGPAQLLGGTTADADQFITLAMVDQEIIAYQTATLASGPSYTLGYLRRGGYGSAIAAHAVNAPFVRLDENILRIPVDPSQIGQTVYLKFVSFNVFGKGGRTLASETAYTYVIGTNVELPDVPLTPVSFTATGVADGVSLTWTNPNPAAVGCTSIEYATASGGPWTVLAQVGPTTTAYAHHFTTGATYYYRARSRGPLVSAGFSAYTATVSNTGTNVGAISNTANTANTTANTANGLATQVPVINGGFDATPYGTGWTMDSQWSIKSDGAGPGVGLGYAQFTPNGSAGAIYNSGRVGVVPGQTYKAQGLIRGSGTPNGVAYVRIRWLDATGAQIAYKNGNIITGNVVGGSFAVDQAPAGAYYAAVMFEVDSCTTGYYQVDNVVATLMPSTIDEVPDGTTNARTLATRVNAGNPLIDFSAGYHLNKNADNIGDGTTYGRFKMSSMTGNDFDFSKGGVNKTVDYVGDGVTYGRPLGSRLNAGNPLIDFSAGYHLNKNLSNIADAGGRYASVYTPALQTTPGANQIRNPTARMGNAYWSTAVATQGNTASDGYYWAMPVTTMATTSVQVGENHAIPAGTVLTIAADMYAGGLTSGTFAADIEFLNSSLGVIATSQAAISAVAGTGWTRYSGTTPAAPAGTAYFHARFYLASAISSNCSIRLIKVQLGSVATPYSDEATANTIDLADTNHVNKNVDNISDGAMYGRTLATRVSAGNPLIDFSAGYHLNKNADNIGDGTTYGRFRMSSMTGNDFDFSKGGVNKTVDYVADGTTYGRPLGSRLNAGNPLIDFSAGYHLNKNLDNIADTASFGRLSIADFTAGNRLGLRIAGSGHRIGDQRNLAQRTITNTPAKVPTVISYSSAAGTPATATISIAAFTVLAGSVSVAYNAMSVSVTGTNGAAVTYYLYFDDPGYAGGTQTLVATTTANDCYAGDGRVYAGSCAFTYPTSGTGSGTPPGGGGTCVCDDMLIDYDTTAGEARLGHLFDCLDIPTQGLRKFRRRLQAVEYAVVPCVRLTTDAGAILECSTTTPFDLPAGGMAYASEMLGQQVVTDRGIETVARVDDIGERRVCHIHLGGVSYAAGVDPAHRIYSHNALKP